MEQNFQTSFIPKKPVIEERVTASKPVGPLVVISLLVLFTALIAAGGLYFYKELTAKRIASMERDLSRAEKRFEPAIISKLQVLDRRLRASGEVLGGHIVVTPIFEALEKTTMKTVRFTKFNYSWPDKDTPVKITMSGQAVGYRSIALQSDLFTQNTSFIDPVFSNLTLDTSGNVLFDLEFSVDPDFLNYKQTVPAES